MEKQTVMHFLMQAAHGAQETQNALLTLMGYFNEDYLNTVVKEYPPTPTLETNLIGNGFTNEPETTQSENRLLQFTEKEISKMSKKVKKFFHTQGYTVHYRKRTDGRYNGSYEIRYAKKPYNNPPISVSATSLEELKARFIEKLNNYIPQADGAPTIPTTFDGFAMYWFENFHKRKVAEKTYIKSLQTYRYNMHKPFEKFKLTDITPVFVQKFLDGFLDKGRTAETIHSLLNQIFVCAVKHGVLKVNPLDMCFYRKHEREHGSAISKQDEKRLLAAYAGTPFQLQFAIALYTGLRPNEYATATINGGFIFAQNSKRKDGRNEFKRIPITPMLRPYLDGITKLKIATPVMLTKRLKAILPNHTLYDMRTTFQTRLTECGVAEVAIGLFMGNAIGSELKKAYTDVSEEWLLKEGEKFSY